MPETDPPRGRHAPERHSDGRTDDNSAAGRTPALGERYRGLIEKRLAEAREAGVFDDLPGAGRPFDFDTSALTSENWLRDHLLRNAGAAPPWMQLQRELRERIDKYHQQEQAFLEELDAALASGDERKESLRETFDRRRPHVRRRLEAEMERINATIEHYNWAVPIQRLQWRPWKQELRLAAFDERCRRRMKPFERDG